MAVWAGMCREGEVCIEIVAGPIHKERPLPTAVKKAFFLKAAINFMVKVSGSYSKTMHLHIKLYS